jgi:hypothetical protein
VEDHVHTLRYIQEVAGIDKVPFTSASGVSGPRMAESFVLAFQVGAQIRYLKPSHIPTRNRTQS